MLSPVRPSVYRSVTRVDLSKTVGSATFTAEYHRPNYALSWRVKIVRHVANKSATSWQTFPSTGKLLWNMTSGFGALSVVCLSGTGGKRLWEYSAGEIVTVSVIRRPFLILPASKVPWNCLAVSSVSVSCTPTTWPASTPASSWLQMSAATSWSGGDGTVQYRITVRSSTPWLT